jgi:predicted AlkP superfamily pyrophosphatase or phosphodiesterase
MVGRLRSLILRLATLVAIAICAPVAWAEAPARPVTVILISIDGLGPGQLQRGHSPTLDRLMAEGAWGPMRPSFPTVTFPNHYTLVTGRHPDGHGVVSNMMEDPAIPGVTFEMSNRAAVTDGLWWDQAEPIWVTAETAGLKTGVLFWPGSEAAIRGVRPTYWDRFRYGLRGDGRVDRVLEWLDAEGPDRPVFLTLYFDLVDTMGHHYGPGDPRVDEAIASVDGSIARLMQGLEARGMAENTVLVIVSDHGIAAAPQDQVIRLGPAVTSGAARILHEGAFAGLAPVEGREAEAEAELLAPHPHMRCWRRGEGPERLGAGRNARWAPIQCLADVGWRILGADTRVRGRGEHGYDNQAPEMQAVFIAHGPGVAQGRLVDGMEAVDVHPLLGRLLGIEVPAGDGRPEATLAVMAP